VRKPNHQLQATLYSAPEPARGIRDVATFVTLEVGGTLPSIASCAGVQPPCFLTPISMPPGPCGGVAGGIPLDPGGRPGVRFRQ